ncbi:hypothetical protein F4779DRAFT_636125 [Xylariaceae sp. FL0662B]|nr:hypothetical protein F4779DRAFT_636125 [Xylariaceae sp. FL0662B]
MYSPTPPPPVPPPKPSSHDTSRLGTPSAANSPRISPGPESGISGLEAKGKAPATDASGLIPAPTGDPQPQPEPIPDPGEQWLPKVLEDKSKQDLAQILGNPALLTALTYAPSTMHPSLGATQAALLEALDANTGLARHLASLEAHLARQRAAAQAQLLSTHALERQWRAKQAEMDAALAPFGPAALYGRLTAALAEQEAVCAALEESFLDAAGLGDGLPGLPGLGFGQGNGGAGAGADGNGNGNGDGAGGGDGKLATEREILDWVRRYRDAKKLFYLRQERKERWNERRVGGWR